MAATKPTAGFGAWSLEGQPACSRHPAWSTLQADGHSVPAKRSWRAVPVDLGSPIPSGDHLFRTRLAGQNAEKTGRLRQVSDHCADLCLDSDAAPSKKPLTPLDGASIRGPSFLMGTLVEPVRARCSWPLPISSGLDWAFPIGSTPLERLDPHGALAPPSTGTPSDREGANLQSQETT